MDWVVRIGLVELAVGGLLGWGMVIRMEKPEWIEKAGIVAPRRILQGHLDYVLMGLILIGGGRVVRPLRKAVAIALVFGTVVNRFVAVPPMFHPDVSERGLYRTL